MKNIVNKIGSKKTKKAQIGQKEIEKGTKCSKLTTELNGTETNINRPCDGNNRKTKIFLRTSNDPL